ncbi:MAG: class I SAM-dependent methyltransferase [Spirochaetales bacterium]|nr:class I SAM-dependent methyltransferase [Spirochaetales bacterium]
MFDQERIREAGPDMDGLESLTQSHPGAGPLLDLGCGPGRHSLELARRGYKVIGIDLHQPYLQQAQDRAIQENLEQSTSFVNADIRHYHAPTPLAGALSLFQTIGYTEDIEDDLSLCKKTQENLAPGGWFLIESDGKEVIARNLEHRTWIEREGRTILLEYTAEAAWTRLRNHWKFQDKEGKWHECDFTYRLFSALEMGQLLEEAGFASIEFFGALDGRPYNQDAQKLVALARKPW